MRCEHKNFEANVEINRMVDIGKFEANIRIKCTDCGLPFQFIGLPGGLNLEGATTSVDRTEARLAIVPLRCKNCELEGVREREDGFCGHCDPWSYE